MFILGIETSCDESSVAVLDERGTVRSNLIASQIERHRPFGGVVPEIASREHLQHLMPLLEAALRKADVELGEINALAVTAGPGLIGALLVGVAAGQGLAYGLGIPLVAVNHLEGHIFSPYLNSEGPATDLPKLFFSLVISGGHSSLYEVDVVTSSIRMMSRTRDDAAGEVFDKVAKFVGLPYPGGPQVESCAASGDPQRFPFTVAQLKGDSLDFSFSGLKAAAIRLARQMGLDQSEQSSSSGQPALADFCASFQRAIGDQILDRLHRAWPTGEGAGELVLAGGVAANGSIRERVQDWGRQRGITVRLPQKLYCTDNGAMIAFAGLRRLKRGEVADGLRVQAQSRMAV